MTGYIEEGKSMGKAVIFDLDGTLLNTLDDLEDSVNHTLNYFKYPKRTKAEVRSFIGGGAKALIKKSLPENVTAEKYEEVLSYFQAYYKKNADKKTGLYPGVKKLVNKLSDENYSIGVVSAKGDIVVKELVESFLGDKVNETLGEKEGIKRKPAPFNELTYYVIIKSYYYERGLFYDFNQRTLCPPRHVRLSGAWQ